MNIRPQFTSYIPHDGCYTKGEHQRVGPERLTGQFVECPELQSYTPSEIFEGVQGSGLMSVCRNNVKGETLTEDMQQVLGLIEKGFQSRKGFEAGQIVANTVTAALGGLPVALGAASVYHPEEMFSGTMFSAKYYVSDNPGGVPVKSNLDSADGTVYVDASTGTLYIHNQPTDPRWR